MKEDDLKSRVLAILVNQSLTVRDVLREINNNNVKKYAYTTIATILKRLELDEMVVSVNMDNDGRRTKVYSIENNAHKIEASKLLRGLFTKFGMVGVQHLGQLLDVELDESGLEELKKKLNL